MDGVRMLVSSTSSADAHGLLTLEFLPLSSSKCAKVNVCSTLDVKSHLLESRSSLNLVQPVHVVFLSTIRKQLATGYPGYLCVCVCIFCQFHNLVAVNCSTLADLRKAK
uniref:Uncharacterized protein n=1 Tax=Micrurus spixii TaxID=129469 RepID=A0A2D4NCQ1_9SAUR